MGVHVADAVAFDSELVTLGTTGLWCRGPLDAGPQAVVFIGGGETQGRFVLHPFPALLAGVCGGAVNLGVAHAGADCIAGLPELAALGVRGRCILVQLPCAANLSNRYYRVHPRRNDRLIGPEPALRRLFPDVDFSEFAFVRAMLVRLRLASPDRFAVLVTGVRDRWSEIMRRVLAGLDGDVRLLWLQGRGVLGPEPAFVTEEMVRSLGRPVYAIRSDSAGMDTTGMVFAPEDREAARAMPGPQQHRDIARALAPKLRLK